MNRNYHVLAVLTVLTAIGLWQLLRDDPQVRLAQGPAESVLAHAAAAVQESAPQVRREVVTTTAPDLAAAPNSESNAPEDIREGLHGIVKELGDVVVPDVGLDLVSKDGVTIASTTSDQAGRFVFPLKAPAGSSLITQLRSGQGPRLRHARIHITGARGLGNPAITVWIPPTGMIEGSVIDATGHPVVGAKVASDRSSQSVGMASWEYLSGGTPKFVVQTDSVGHFVLSGLLRGSHRLRALHGGAEGSGRFPVGDRAAVLQLGNHLGGVVVIDGRLRDRATGAGIVNAKVSVQHVREWKNGSSRNRVAQVVTNEQGRYEVLGLEVGDYQLSAAAKGYATSRLATRKFEAGGHAVDFALDPARDLLVHVVLPDGAPASPADIRVLDAAGHRLQVPGEMMIPSDAVRVDQAGTARLRQLPAAPLTLLAVRGDLLPAGRLDVDLSAAAPKSVTIVMPTGRGGFARTHYFKLLGPDGDPAKFDGTVVAESFDGSELLSRVVGRWRGKQFVFGHDERNGFSIPTIAVGALAGACRVEITVPGYRKYTLTLVPGTSSPTSVRLPQ